MQSWDITRSINFKCLKLFEGSYAVIKYVYSNSFSSGTNYCISELFYPPISVLCVGAVVMLLTNYVMEEKIITGSIGTVKEIA